MKRETPLQQAFNDGRLIRQFHERVRTQGPLDRLGVIEERLGKLEEHLRRFLPGDCADPHDEMTKLKSSVDADSDEWKAIIEILGPARFIYFPDKEEIVRRPVPKTIRELLHAVGEIKRRKILRIVTSKSKPTVTFETKESK